MIYRDQELRFTVHESPDYYQLKVSVFNDDKRTELIGETHIRLEDIIVPGGGQNDTWHILHCKGRFAGEIRIELTYYDTRPKEEQLPERQSEAEVNGHQELSREGVGGPRGPKPLKRRPLPANPTDLQRPSMPEHAHSSPLPHPTPQVIHQPTPSYPDRIGRRDHALESTPSSGSRHQPAQYHSSTGSPLGHDLNLQWSHGHESSARDYEHQPEKDHYTHNATFDLPTQDLHNGHYEQYPPIQNLVEHARHSDVGAQYPDAHQPSGLPLRTSHSSSYEHGHQSVEQPEYESYNNVYSHSPPAIPHGYSMPDVRAPGIPVVPDHQSHRRSLPNSRGYNERSPMQQLPPHGSFDAYSHPDPSTADDDVPPPPPAHRTNSGVSPSPMGNGRSHSDSCAPIPGTAPLNIRKERGSFSNSPLSQVHTTTSYAEYAPSPSPSPSHAQHYTHSTAMVTSRHANDPRPQEPYHRRSVSPVRNGCAMPPSLVPGPAPITPSNVPQNMAYNSRSRHGDMRDYEVASQYQTAPTPPMQARTDHAAAIHAQGPLQAIERGSDRQPNRASAPAIQQRAKSPDPRVPMRKSVSPQPESTPSERRGSGVPFGPDSYDALNPYVSGSASPSPGARYETPEQAKDAAIQHERAKKLGEGPIIGSDGRVIDPSDHLPTDTWAPEPETKAPRKTAQVNLRFRNSPQGAQPMPRASTRVPHESSARPASLSTPTYNGNANNMPENISPVTAARARLQKKTRVSPAQPNSSPIVPTVNSALQNPVLRSTASDYPLREHENYGYGSSPPYSRSSPSGIPPPVPGKVPIGMAQEDWRRDPLSEELSRIDIGVGGGRTRRSRYHG